MTMGSFLVSSVAFLSVGLIIPSQSLSLDYADLPGDLGDATVSVLDKLGYDCQTASVGGIICKKCKTEDNKQKCVAYLCDAITKKCRKKSAEIPKLPNLGG